MNVLQLFADNGGERRGELRLSPRREMGERGDRRPPKRCERMLLPGEVGRGVLGMPWLESGRKNLVRLLKVEAELGGDWLGSIE
jgi:hypothetical protein